MGFVCVQMFIWRTPASRWHEPWSCNTEADMVDNKMLAQASLCGRQSCTGSVITKWSLNANFKDYMLLQPHGLKKM